jgi:hypothetical protein
MSETSLSPIHLPVQTITKLDKGIVASISKPHLFHPQLMPVRRLALVYGRPKDEKALAIIEYLRCAREINVVTLEVTPDTVNQAHTLVPKVIFFCGTLKSPFGGC